jgi:hypothetical protein
VLGYYPNVEGEDFSPEHFHTSRLTKEELNMIEEHDEHELNFEEPFDFEYEEEKGSG